jgi:hypothetical protein
MLLEQVSESTHLLLQSGELGLQGGECLREREQFRGQGGNARSGRCGLSLRQQRQCALMQMSQQPQMVLTQSVFAPIVRMGVERQVRMGEPAAQGFGIDVQMPTGIGDRNEGHGATPFRVAGDTNDTHMGPSQEEAEEQSRERSLR